MRLLNWLFRHSPIIDWREGNANRWHNHRVAALRNSKDDIRGHMERVRKLCLYICLELGFVASDELHYAALEHDLPELIMGDLPYTLTRDYWVARWAKRILEWQIKRRMGLRWKLTRQEKLILALADKLDAVEWAAGYTTREEFWHYFTGDVVLIQSIAVGIDQRVLRWALARLEKLDHAGGV
jgi:5'-deoxynucleotidase YfbR-like HD superfamily hydrolase